jgi:cleavage stimulation factor subunit 3
LDRKEALRQKIAADKYDTDAWTQLIMEVQSGPVDVARPIYEEFLQVFPTAGRYWKFYAEHEIQSGNYDNAERVFMQSLPACPNIDLWKSYIKYIVDFKSKLPGQRETVLKAFDFAVAHVGMDVR